jgi:hypothetical protein
MFHITVNGQMEYSLCQSMLRMDGPNCSGEISPLVIFTDTPEGSSGGGNSHETPAIHPTERD